MEGTNHISSTQKDKLKIKSNFLKVLDLDLSTYLPTYLPRLNL